MKSLLGLTTGNSGTVTVSGTGVSIDLSNNTLEDIAAAIDAVPGVTATVEEETENEETYYYLKILGTTNFSDSNNILETIGILKGGMNEVAEVKDGSVTNTTDGSTPITASTAWADIYGANIAVDDTISFTGTDHDGNAVSGSLTITSTSGTVQELLTSIESAFSNNVTASISSGKLRITDDTTGNSYLTLTLTENNEGGGFLDFGTIASSTKGREREIQTGLDSSFEIDGIPMVKSSNTVTDALPGVTLNLIKASTSTTVNFSISRNTSSIKNDINSFISLYNENINYINSQYNWDDDKKQGGALMGDGTLFTVQSQLRETIFSQVTGLPSDYVSYLSEIGITASSSGILSANDSILSSAISNDFDNVRKLFIGFGTASDSDIDFISYTPNTVSGEYDLSITAAAEQGSTTGSTAINGGGITSNDFRDQ
ncbi:flagellar filament capping protein FliD, partial [Candidatus Desantisbacteria bacterium]|nr:flagellar filament capping protein FliD [Candidatus Desantisbacteria bacterium]